MRNFPLLHSSRLWVTLTYLVFGVVFITTITFRSQVAGGENYSVDQQQAGRLARIFVKGTTQDYVGGSPARLTIMLDSGGSVLAGANVVIAYQPELVKDVKISFEGSHCASLPGYDIDAEAGSIRFSCDRFNATNANQIQPLAVVTLTPLGTTSPTLLFDEATNVTSIQNKSVLRVAEPYTVSLKSLTQATGPRLVTLANHTSMAEVCTPATTAFFSWLKDADMAKFLYSWKSEAPAKPTISTISTTVNLPLEKGTSYFFSIQAVDDKGTLGPIRSTRVVSCP